jgi:hypothetical protein
LLLYIFKGWNKTGIRVTLHIMDLFNFDYVYAPLAFSTSSALIY